MMKEEEEAVTSNGMNVVDDNTNNIYSTSDSDDNRIGEDDDCNLNQISQVWGTWEELLLTCAVKRHGFMDWDSVSKEVSSRSSLIASAGNCRIKYQDLKRRFQDSVDGESASALEVEDKVGEITWLEQLRSLRVAELRRDVQRCDDSILSLQLKVKKLEEEKDGDDGDKKPDLEDDETKPVGLNRETTESDRENGSMNESNSTGSIEKTADHDRLTGDKSVKAYVNSRNPDPDPVREAAAMAKEEGEEGTVSRRSEMSNSGELGESGTSTGHEKRKGLKYRSGEESSNRGGSGGDIKSSGGKSQPLIEIIKLIRSHPRGSVFESRLRSQETKDYKSLIRQHLDIKTIEKKLEKGCYVSSSQSFYRDIKLLFTNAIVFFPTSSSESMAAHELRNLVANEMNKLTGKSGHIVIKAEAESSVSRQKSSVLPLVACKKPKKMSPSSSFKQKDEKKSQKVVEEKTVTTTTTAAVARSLRRTSKGNDVVTKETKTGRAKNNSNKKQTDSKSESSNDDDDVDKEETPKTEKKIASDKKKSVADFLKRIKKNSPQKAKETTSKDQKKKSDVNVKKEAKPRELRSNSTGKKKVEVENNSNKSSLKRKQPKKEAEEVATATGKRGRESGKDNKQQPKKRSRR